MAQKDDLEQLLLWLLAERGISTRLPDDIVQKRQLLHSLMNERPARDRKRRSRKSTPHLSTFLLQAGTDRPEWRLRKGDMLVTDSAAKASDGKKAIAEL